MRAPIISSAAHRALVSLALLGALLVAGCTEAGDPLFVAVDVPLIDDSQPVDFASQVLPIFEARCTPCHIPPSALGGLQLHDHASALAGGQSAPGRATVVPCDPDDSFLIDKVENRPPAAGSPMPLTGAPLSVEQVMLLRRWIAEGATATPEEGACQPAEGE